MSGTSLQPPGLPGSPADLQAPGPTPTLTPAPLQTWHPVPGCSTLSQDPAPCPRTQHPVPGRGTLIQDLAP